MKRKILPIVELIIFAAMLVFFFISIITEVVTGKWLDWGFNLLVIISIIIILRRAIYIIVSNPNKEKK